MQAVEVCGEMMTSEPDEVPSSHAYSHQTRVQNFCLQQLDSAAALSDHEDAVQLAQQVLIGWPHTEECFMGDS